MLQRLVDHVRVYEHVARLALAAPELREVGEPLRRAEVHRLRDVKAEIEAAVVGRRQRDDELARLLNLSF